MRILYAASKWSSSKLQLLRFLENLDFTKHTVKIAAYKNYCPNIHIDFLLDPLQSLNRATSNINIDNNNYNLSIYVDFIKNFNPDLVISDLEFTSSYLALELNKKLWNVSSMLMHFGIGLKDKRDLVFMNKFLHVVKNTFNNTSYQNYHHILAYATKNYLYSHFGEYNSLKLNDGFEWVRPYYKIMPPKKTDTFCVSYLNNRNIIKKIKNKAVVFSEFSDEAFPNVELKNMYHQNEYYADLAGCDYLMCTANTLFLADAYYNNKFANIIPVYDNIECLYNMLMAEKMGTGKIIYNNDALVPASEIRTHINPDIKSLGDLL